MFCPGILPEGPFDRAIVPTPYGRDILERIIPLIKSGGIIHFYTLKTENRAKKGQTNSKKGR